MPVAPRPAPPRAAAPRRQRGRRRMATVAVAATLVAAATGCIGKTGRNDDYVEPGSTDRGPSGQVVPADG